MIQAVLLTSWFWLLPAMASPTPAQKGSPRTQSSLGETEALPHTLFKQLFLPDAETCQHLLHAAPSLAPLPGYLSSLAVELALEEVGCPQEADGLQRQLGRMARKDVAETLHESIKPDEEGEVGDTQVISGDPSVDLVVSPGQLRRVQRSVTLPETCKSEYGWVFHETATLVAEFADKLPTTDLVKELKSTAIQSAQECTSESWERLEEVANRLVESPEIHQDSLSLQDKIYFLKRCVSIVVRIILDFIQKEVKRYFW
ncbi:apolipoprotein F-like [Sorex araneus]|uniref:apolipoprotein F-like n=1 Tax=Sorex araneus TaxID=42254 RepID=UPI002433F46C|nr:apolipoprotein F-like [Sorex araneus]